MNPARQQRSCERQRALLAAGRKLIERRDFGAPSIAGIPAGRRKPRIRFAMQLIYGTLVRAVLYDPGPIPLEDKRMVNHLAQAFVAYPGIGKA